MTLTLKRDALSSLTFSYSSPFLFFTLLFSVFCSFLLTLFVLSLSSLLFGYSLVSRSCFLSCVSLSFTFLFLSSLSCESKLSVDRHSSYLPHNPMTGPSCPRRRVVLTGFQSPGMREMNIIVRSTFYLLFVRKH